MVENSFVYISAAVNGETSGCAMSWTTALHTLEVSAEILCHILN